MSMAALDWRPWWHSRHRLAATGLRFPLSSFSLLKVRLLPLGNGTLTTARTVYLVRSLWQVVQAKPLAVSCSPTPVVTIAPALVTATVPPDSRNSGKPLALWHLAQPAGTAPSASQSRNAMAVPSKWPASLRTALVMSTGLASLVFRSLIESYINWMTYLALCASLPGSLLATW